MRLYCAARHNIIQELRYSLMAPLKKVGSQAGKTSNFNGLSPRKSGENACRNRQRKRKLSDMLGPLWSKAELEHFYEAYRKHGKDWKKVAASVCSRSAEMVEALYTMNRAYLSLPEGTASVIGLIAMMTDHYCILGSDSDQESSEAVGTSKRRNRARGKSIEPLKELEVASDSLLFKSSAADCLSVLKKKHTESMPRAVGKRTPRVPVSYSSEKNNEEKARRDVRPEQDFNDDHVAHEIAMALTEASQRGGSLVVSQITSAREKLCSVIKKSGRRHFGSGTTITRFHVSEMDDACELSLESAEADNGDYAEISCVKAAEGSQMGEFQHQGRRQCRKVEIEESFKANLHDSKEACSGTEEGKLRTSKVKYETDDVKKPASALSKDLKNKTKKVLFERDEGPAFDALQTLADLSVMMPESVTDTGISEPYVRVKEEKTSRDSVSKLIGNSLAARVKSVTLKMPRQKKLVIHDFSFSPGSERHNIAKSSMPKRRKKSSPAEDVFCSKERKDVESLVCKSSNIDNFGERNDSNQSTQIVFSPNLASLNQHSLPSSVRSRRKIQIQKSLMKANHKCSENIVSMQSDKKFFSVSGCVLDLKEGLSNFLSWYQARNWCISEWFYSAIDYPWFAKQEFIDYLDHVGLGNIPRLTRIEWGVIRSSLGKPRRFSEQFLKEEKKKLNQYRESVRKHYREFHAGLREGLPDDLVPPLNAGQKVIALHPKNREIHDGSVLTVDHSSYGIQFDQPELGVEVVKDIDCMPCSGWESMSESLLGHHDNVKHNFENFSESKYGRTSERHTGVHREVTCEKLETNSFSNLPAANYHGNPDPQHPKALEADVQALSKLTLALDKKELIVSELKRMNDEVSESQNDGKNTLKDTESFKKHYAAVLFQLNEINEQVSSALFQLRQRNKYQDKFAYLCPTPGSGIKEMSGYLVYSDKCAPYMGRSGSHVAEIIDVSKIKAHEMVVAAMQAMASLKKEKRIERTEDAIDSINTQLSDFYLSDHVNQRAITRVASTGTSIRDFLLSMPLQNEVGTPSGLITCCVATLLMIQKCAERHFPPGDVAQVLDSAVASLQPRSLQNLPIYAEIRKYMGIIRSQILALIPT